MKFTEKLKQYEEFLKNEDESGVHEFDGINENNLIIRTFISSIIYIIVSVANLMFFISTILLMPFWWRWKMSMVIYLNFILKQLNNEDYRETR